MEAKEPSGSQLLEFSGVSGRPRSSRRQRRQLRDSPARKKSLQGKTHDSQAGFRSKHTYIFKTSAKCWRSRTTTHIRTWSGQSLREFAPPIQLHFHSTHPARQSKSEHRDSLTEPLTGIFEPCLLLYAEPGNRVQPLLSSRVPAFSNLLWPLMHVSVCHDSTDSSRINLRNGFRALGLK